MKYSVDELKDMAQPIMEEYNVDVVHATSDGQIFIKKTRAQQHANEKGLGLYEIAKHVEIGADEPNEDGSLASLTISMIKGMVNDIEDLEVLGKMLAEEEAGGNRKGAIKAIADKIEFLQKENEEEDQEEAEEEDQEEEATKEEDSKEETAE